MLPSVKVAFTKYRYDTRGYETRLASGESYLSLAAVVRFHVHALSRTIDRSVAILYFHVARTNISIALFFDKRDSRGSIIKRYIDLNCGESNTITR